jgi:hypothetical protein
MYFETRHLVIIASAIHHTLSIMEATNHREECTHPPSGMHLLRVTVEPVSTTSNLTVALRMSKLDVMGSSEEARWKGSTVCCKNIDSAVINRPQLKDQFELISDGKTTANKAFSFPPPTILPPSYHLTVKLLL